MTQSSKYDFFYILIVYLLFIVICVNGSVGDGSNFFVNCVKSCQNKNCTNDGIDFIHKNTNINDNNLMESSYLNHLFLWSCSDECKYHCMWRTTNIFVERGWNVPQFYGKWPFIRMLGIQEPASTIFSLLNFLAHFRKIKEFRNKVRSDSPMYYVWHVFCAICLNGWVWSMIFHTRDFPITELFDYTFAYSMVLASCYCMVFRMLHRKSQIIKILISTITIIYFLNHFAHLSVGQFDYSYNMKANVVTGLLGGIGWIAWYFLQRKKRPYAWKVIVFQLLAAASLSLELKDFPPIWWTFDAHSLWHLMTVPLTILFWNFIIDDCKQLRTENYETLPQIDEQQNKKKLI